MRKTTQIRFAVAFVVVVVALGGVWLIPGSATTVATGRAAVSADDCEALQDVGDEVPDVQSAGSLGKAQLAATAEGMAATAEKIEDKKLKSALNTLSDLYEGASKAKGKLGAVGVFMKSGKRYGKATATYSTSLLSCVTSQITLPSNITLPGGITLPTLPR